jgi:2-alkyl-3-oxoalkanoate reductase
VSKRFHAGLVGIGDICERHIAAVRALPDVELVGFTDTERKAGHELSERLDTVYFNSIEQMIEAGANVIHVLTSPGTHAKIAKTALEKGCHVLVEKPIADTEKEALEIGRVAQQKGLIATVCHALLYDPQIKRALETARSGALGQIVSVDIQRGAEYPPYEGGPLPVWYRDAGYPFRDLGVDCLILLQELLGPIDDVDANWRSVGGDPNLVFDEWRAMVRCKRGLGQFQVSFNTPPSKSQLAIHGTTGVLRVDLFTGLRHMRSFQEVIDRYVRNESQAYHALRDFVADFYRRLSTDDAEPPVLIEDAAKITRWVEKVSRTADDHQKQRLAKFPLSEKVPFLVTGANGNLGKPIVERLREQGHRVRVLVRRMPDHPQDGIEYVFGNLGDPDAVNRAVEGAETVIHAGAAMKGGWPEHKVATVLGTQNVIDACWRYKTKQLVHISSMSVIDWAGMSGNGVVNEGVALEPRASERGAYTRAKLEAEKLVVEAATKGLPCVILRPGQIFGGGIPLINGAVARNARGRWLVLGDGKLELPLVYIDDVVDAILGAVDKRLSKGEVIQIIDPVTLTQKDVLELAGGDKRVLRVPRPLVFALGRLSEVPLGVLGKPSPIGLYRLKSALARLQYESDRASTLLGWRPRVGVREGIKRVM